jgi:hypothetical protein
MNDPANIPVFILLNGMEKVGMKVEIEGLNQQ